MHGSSKAPKPGMQLRWFPRIVLYLANKYPMQGVLLLTLEAGHRQDMGTLLWY